jgi:hypothetical protein
MKKMEALVFSMPSLIQYVIVSKESWIEANSIVGHTDTVLPQFMTITVQICRCIFVCMARVCTSLDPLGLVPET